MKPTDEIVERIRKCLALANGRNATPGEMEAAMGKAKEIAMRYQIDIASIDMKAGKSAGASLNIDKTQLRVRSKNQQQYHRWIYGVLREVFGIRVITQGPLIYFIGEATDVTISKELFPWLEEVFWSTFMRGVKSGLLEQYRAADRNGCYCGLYQGIIRNNEREEEKLNTTDKACMALIVIDKTALIEKRVEQEFPEMRKSKKRSLQMSSRSHAHGYATGIKTTLRQSGAGATRGQLQ